MSDKPPTDPRLLSHARTMRAGQSIAESKLWGELRNGRFGGTKWRRQYVVAGYILDFYCHALRLAIELDGESHDDAVAYDDGRSAALAKSGVVVIRFTNEDVISSLESVLRGIDREARDAITRLDAK